MEDYWKKISFLVIFLLFFSVTPLVAQEKKKKKPKREISILVQAYLEAKFVDNPAYPLGSRYYKFTGDNRGPNRKGTSRIWQEVIVDLDGQDPQVKVKKGTGKTTGYYKTLFGKVKTDSDRAPQDKLYAEAVRQGERVIVRFRASAGNPMVTVSPAIDYQFTIQFRREKKNHTWRYGLHGKHDGCPSFSVWVGDKLAYNYSKEKRGGSLSDLLPPMDQSVKKSGHLVLKQFRAQATKSPGVDLANIPLRLRIFIPGKREENPSYPWRSKYPCFSGNNRGPSRTKGTERMSYQVVVNGKKGQKTLVSRQIRAGEFEAYLDKSGKKSHRAIMTLKNTRLKVKREKKRIVILVKGSLANPKIKSSPATDFDLKIGIAPQKGSINWTIDGTHDGYPSFEIWMGKELVYYWNHQLEGKGFSQTLPPEEVEVRSGGSLPLKSSKGK